MHFVHFNLSTSHTCIVLDAVSISYLISKVCDIIFCQDTVLEKLKKPHHVTLEQRHHDPSLSPNPEILQIPLD